MKKLLTILSIALLLGACTGNEQARMWGGTETILLPAGEKLILATWKDADLWYLTERAPQGHVPRKLQFRESSNFGVMNGTVIFQEQ